MSHHLHIRFLNGRIEQMGIDRQHPKERMLTKHGIPNVILTDSLSRLAHS